MKILFSFFAVVGIVAALAILTVQSQERQECATWAAQSRAVHHWKSYEWQIAQCHAYGVTLADTAAYIAILRVEAPETLAAPIRSQFTDQSSYEKAAARFAYLGYWATEE